MGTARLRAAVAAFAVILLSASACATAAASVGVDPHLAAGTPQTVMPLSYSGGVASAPWADPFCPPAEGTQNIDPGVPPGSWGSLLAQEAKDHLLEDAEQTAFDDTVTQDWNTYLAQHNGQTPPHYSTLDEAKSGLWSLALSIFLDQNTWEGILQRIDNVSKPTAADPWEYLAHLDLYQNGVSSVACDGNDGYRLYQTNALYGATRYLWQLGPDGTWAKVIFDASAPQPPVNAQWTPVPGAQRAYVASVPTANLRDPYGIPMAQVVGELQLNASADVHPCTTDESTTGTVGNQLAGDVAQQFIQVASWVPDVPVPTVSQKCATVDAVYTPWTSGPAIPQGAFAIADRAEYIAGYTATSQAATIDRWQRTGSSWSTGEAVAGPTFNQGFEDVLPRLAISGDGQTVASCWITPPLLGSRFSLQDSFQSGYQARYPEIFHFDSGALDYPSTGTTDPQSCSDVSLDETGQTVWYQQRNAGWYSSSTAPALAAPILSLPGDQTVQASSPDGAVVSYSASAADANGAVPVTCDPQSGSVFPIGSTTVSCTASNDGGIGTGSFQVSVDARSQQSISFPQTTTTYGQGASDPASASSALPIIYTDAQGACATNGDGSLQIVAAGTCSVTATQPGNAQYEPAAPVTQMIAVEPATLVINADSASALYGSAPQLSYKIDGFVGGDSPQSAGLSGAAHCSVPSADTAAGSYPSAISCDPGTLSAANYQFLSGSSGDLTIQPVTVHVDADPAAGVYGTADPFPTARLRIRDFLGGETPTTAQVTGAASCQIASHSQNAATYAGVVSCLPGTLSAPNYQFVPGDPADLTISPAMVHVDAASASTTYGQADPDPAGTLRVSEFAYGETPAIAGVVGVPSCVISQHALGAATYSGAISCGPGSLSAANYRFVSGSTADLKIDPAVIHVDANPVARTYGGSDPQPSGTLRAGDFAYADNASNSAITGQASCQIAPHAANAGRYSAAISCSEGSLTAPNYRFASGASAELTINPATIHVDAAPATRTYGSPDPLAAPILRASDFVGADNQSNTPISGSASCSFAQHPTDAGTYIGVIGCDPGSLSSANYRFLAGRSADLTILPALLTVQADSQSRLFGASNSPLTATITGFVAGQNLTSSGVTGIASCSTTASTSSPGGSYPITCSRGTLASTNYGFAFLSGSLLVGYSKTVTGASSGPITIANGQAVLLAPGASTSGPITVQPGGALDVSGATLSGPLNSQGAAALRLCHTTLTGPLNVSASRGLVVLGDDDGAIPCSGNNVTGPVALTANAAAVEFDANTVTGPLTITGNSGSLGPPDAGSVDVVHNNVSGKQTVQAP